MIKYSCNLIGQENNLTNHLKVYVLHDQKKKTLLSLWIQLLLHSELLLMWPYHIQIYSWYVLACLGMTGHAWPHPTNSSILNTIFPYLLSLYEKSIALVVSLQRYWWSKNRRMIKDDHRILLSYWTRAHFGLSLEFLWLKPMKKCFSLLKN